MYFKPIVINQHLLLTCNNYLLSIISNAGNSVGINLLKIMNIEVQIKNVYGNELKYVTDAEQAKLISQLTGRTTVTDSDIRALKGLGFTFTAKVPTV